jgi:hypothetical protein
VHNRRILVASLFHSPLAGFHSPANAITCRQTSSDSRIPRPRKLSTAGLEPTE